MVTALAVTDESGRTISGFGGDCYRASKVSINDTCVYKREPEKHHVSVNTIDALVNNPKYNLLATYVLDKLELSRRKLVRNGRHGQVKWIEVDGQTYWSRGYEIHDRY